MTPAEIAAAIQAGSAALQIALDLFKIAKNNGADIDTDALLAEANALQVQVQAYRALTEDPNQT
jgi:hypothetical protein